MFISNPPCQISKSLFLLLPQKSLNHIHLNSASHFIVKEIYLNCKADYITPLIKPLQDQIPETCTQAPKTWPSSFLPPYSLSPSYTLILSSCLWFPALTKWFHVWYFCSQFSQNIFSINLNGNGKFQFSIKISLIPSTYPSRCFQRKPP